MMGWFKLALMLVCVGLVLGSVVTAVTTFVWKAWGRQFEPVFTSRMVLLLAIFPLFLSGLFLVGAFGPSVLHVFDVVGDHCGSHGDHHSFHLCFLHGNFLHVGNWILAVSGLCVGVVFWRWGRLWQELRRARHAVEGILALSAFSEAQDIWEIDSDRPVAFVVGMLTPKVCISKGLYDRLNQEQVQVVLAHERAHVKYRDALGLFLLKVLRPFHVGWVHRFLVSSFELSREQVCDEVASEVGGRLFVAETILAFGRLQEPRLMPSGLLAFGQSEIEQRVRFLLSEDRRGGLARHMLMGGCLMSVGMFIALLPDIHHAMESALADVIAFFF